MELIALRIIIPQVGKWYYPLISYRTINAEELSSWTFADAMAFVGADLAVAA